MLHLRPALALSAFLTFGIAPATQAWNPHAGANDIAAPARIYHVMPKYTPPAMPSPVAVAPLSAPVSVAPALATMPSMPAPVVPAPTPALAYAPPPPAPVAPAPIASVVAPPVTSLAPIPAPAPQSAYAPYVPPARVADAYPGPAAPPTSRYNDSAAPPATTDYHPKYTTHAVIGIEGFYDRYQEPMFDLDNRAFYGSFSADLTHYFTPTWFGEWDNRFSYGTEHYHSISGDSSDNRQKEAEIRFLAGYNQGFRYGRIKPFIGLGTRYYMDDSKDSVTDTGALGYDRRILQFYLPVGVGYEFTAFDLQWAPKIEVDPLLYGRVDSRLQNVGFYEALNNQHEGFGWRGEVMVGHVTPQGMGWQAGPFIRSWNVKQSDTYTFPDGAGYGYEPHNTRTQLGLALKFLI